MSELIASSPEDSHPSDEALNLTAGAKRPSPQDHEGDEGHDKDHEVVPVKKRKRVNFNLGSNSIEKNWLEFCPEKLLFLACDSLH